MANDNVIDKVRKLLNLASAAGSEGEAQAASKQAQALLSKYRISMAEIESETDSDDNGAGADILRNEAAHVESGGKIAAWKIALMSAICDVNGCKLLLNQHYAGFGNQGHGIRRKKEHSFLIIGTEADAGLCSAFYTSLRDTVESLAKSNKPAGLARGEGKNWATSFKVGCVYAINSRLREGAQEAREEAKALNQCQALAVVDNRSEALESYMNETYHQGRGKAKKGQKKLSSRQASKSNIDYGAYTSGHRAGEKVNLSTKVLGQ